MVTLIRDNMGKRTLVNSLLVSLVFIAAIGIFWYKDNKRQKILGELRQEYPLIDIDLSVNGKVRQIYLPFQDLFNNDPLHAYVVLDSTKVQFKTGFELSSKALLDSVLSIGDYLIKPSGTDVLTIKKVTKSDTTTYRFQLTDAKGYPLKKR